MFPTLLAEAARYGITHKQMREAAGISQKSLSNKMTGKTQFTLREARAISQLFPVDLTIDDLFSSDGFRDTA